jgi:hypothetical protein
MYSLKLHIQLMPQCTHIQIVNMNYYISLIEKLPFTLIIILPLLLLNKDNTRKKHIVGIILIIWNILIGIAFYMLIFTKNNSDNAHPLISFVESFPFVLVLIFTCIGLIKNSELRKTIVISILSLWLIVMYIAIYMLVRI